MTTCRAAITAGTEKRRDEVLLEGIRWVSERQAETGGEVLVLLPRMQLVDEHQRLKAFARRPEVTASTTRQRRGFGSSIVLAAWPTADGFAEIAGSQYLRALCLLPWDMPTLRAPWIDAWAEAADAEYLGGAAPRVSEIDVDPVVAVALRDLASLGDFGTLGRGFIKSTIKRLADAGYETPPDRVHAFLVREKYPARLAGEARDYAQKVATGHRLNDPSVGALRDDIVEVWRAKAGATPPAVPPRKRSREW